MSTMYNYRQHLMDELPSILNDIRLYDCLRRGWGEGCVCACISSELSRKSASEMLSTYLQRVATVNVHMIVESVRLPEGVLCVRVHCVRVHCVRLYNYVNQNYGTP